MPLLLKIYASVMLLFVGAAVTSAFTDRERLAYLLAHIAWGMLTAFLVCRLLAFIWSN